MDLNTIITGITDFFTSVPWQNVIQSFIGSVNGINWDSLAGLFDWFDFTEGPLQEFIDNLTNIFSSLF